ncbi:MAG: 16S rRNA (uracil(1498)-N(3))-methyltransferase [Methylocystaceae bacterium]|nr:16S rRNA (uracil(1498)-N(3))-methyltransferase [Methylocystaceae bacterium]
MSTAPRLFVSIPLCEGQAVELSAEQAHYLNNVMRKAVGDDLLLFNGQDGEWAGVIAQARKKVCIVNVTHKTREQDVCPDIHLVFAPIKKQRLDFIIEKATELGVAALRPVITRRTIVSKIRIDRLEAQAIEAAEQCERLHIPVVQDSVSIEQLVADWSEDRTLFVLDERGGAQPINQALNENKSQTCAILTGPEGGFDPSELDLLDKVKNVVRISVGPRILRADTAALAAISCWQSVVGDWQMPLRDRFGDE